MPSNPKFAVQSRNPGTPSFAKMPNDVGAHRIEFRTWLLPALQAVLTGSSTALAVLLVVAWRPNRSRVIPFYSDASHSDPERVVLAVGENMACFFMPIVALAEYLQQSRLALEHPRPFAPRLFPCLLPLPAHWLSTRAIVHANAIATASTTVFFFITANVPSKHPFTKPHQFAASALIFVYALQATLKALLAQTFSNYKLDVAHDNEIGARRQDFPGASEDESTGYGDSKTRESGVGKHKIGSFGWWNRHHLKVRLLIAGVLWLSLITTWICFMGRVLLRRTEAEYEWARDVREGLSLTMAVIVHAATGSCVVLMAIMAVDMRHERVILLGTAA